MTTETTHEASDLYQYDGNVPCVCGRKVALRNVQRHRDQEGEVTSWTGLCPACGTPHTVFND